MAELRPRLVGAHPSGPGLTACLKGLVREGDFITAASDQRLKAVGELVPELEGVEFCSFVELTGRFLDMMGLPRGRVAVPAQQVVALASILPKISEESPFHHSRRHPGLHRLAAERLSDLRMWGLDAVGLHDLVPQAGEILAEKLRSLADLDVAMRHLFDGMGREFAADRITRCLEAEPTHAFPIKRIIAFGDRDENPLFEKWLMWAAKAGVEVHLVLDWRHEEGMFLPSRRTAARMGATIEEHLPAAWHDALFSAHVAHDAPICSIVSAADPLGECEWALRRCLDLRKDGVLDHQIIIFARNAELYGPLLHAAAARYSVPIKANWSVPLLSSGFARIVLELLKVAVGTDVRAIGQLAKSSYFQCPAVFRGELRTQLAAARRTPDEWGQMLEWAEARKAEFPWLWAFLDWRRQVSDESSPLSVWLERLREFPPKLGIVEAAAKLHQTADRDHRAFGVLHASLSQVAMVAHAGDAREYTLTEFVRLADRTWEEATLAPSTQDRFGIHFASSTESLASGHTVIVLGLLEGSFPRRRAEDPLLTDSDIADLKSLTEGRCDLPNSFERAAQERDDFVRLMACAEKEIWLSTPQADESQDNIPAFYLEELSRALGGREVRRTYSRTELAPEEENCTNIADLRLAQAFKAERVVPERPALSAEAARELVRPDFQTGVPVDELQDALACPFQAVFRHELKVRSARRRLLASFLRDVPRRAGLAATADAEAARDALWRETERAIEDAAPDLEAWEHRLLSLAAERWVDEWVAREFAARSLWPRAPGSLLTDVRLGDGGLKNEAGRPGETYRWTDRANSAWESMDYSAVSLWLGATPSGSFQEEDEDWARDSRLKIGLWLMALFGSGTPRSAVEVDSVAGPRRLFFFGKEPLPRRRHGDDVSVTRVGESPAFFRPISEARLEAVKRLRQADAKPTPKDEWCRTCPYGELCRSSSEFGESVSLFEEEG